MSVNWGLGLAPDVAGSAFGSFMKGQELRREDDSRKAMTSYVTNPNDQNLNALAPYNPGFVLEQRQQQQQQQAQQQERQLIGDAISHPDPNVRQQARQKLAYTNSEMYLKLGEQDRQKVDASMKALGQMAFSIKQLPPEQRGPAMQQAMQWMEANGFDMKGIQLSGDPDMDLNAALAVTGQLGDFERFAKPEYVPNSEWGMKGFRFGRPMDDIPPPQQQMASPPPAAVEELRRNPESAAQFDEIFGPGAAKRALGGAGSNASGGFPE